MGLENDHYRIDCPECSGSLIQDERFGETVCPHCGLVVSERGIASQAERAYTSEQIARKRSHGSPNTALTADINDNVFIDKREIRDRNFQRALRWGSSNNSHRSLKESLYELRKIVSKLRLPQDILMESAKICKKVVNNSLLKGRSIEGIVRACLYYAIRSSGHPTSIEDLVEGVEKARKKELIKKVRKFYSLILSQFGISLKPVNPKKYIPRFVNELGYQQMLQVSCHKFTDWIMRSNIINGKDPKGICGAIIYLVAKDLNYQINQKRISKISGVTEVTLRTRSKEIQKILKNTKTTISQIIEPRDAEVIEKLFERKIDLVSKNKHLCVEEYFSVLMKHEENKRKLEALTMAQCEDLAVSKIFGKKREIIQKETPHMNLFEYLNYLALVN